MPIGSNVTDANLSLLHRTDGIYQVVYFGWPLYTYINDSLANNANG